MGGLPGRDAVDLGLERMHALLDALGRPDAAIPCVVHVAGTNGKGSTAAMLAAALRASGRRTALYVSPHLEHEREVFQIDGRPIAPDELRRLGDLVARAGQAVALRRGQEPTRFEAMTAVMLLWAARQAVDALVLEVGLGGRLDATNAVRATHLSVITPIDLDHTAWLGPTVADIAREKAGIIRPGVPVVTAAAGEALEVVTRVAQERGAPLLRLGHEFAVSGVRAGAGGTRFTLVCPDGRRWPLCCRLAGPHQAVNAALAAVGALCLGLDPAAVEAGLQRVRWPGRFEVIRRRPAVVLDAAHNPAGMEALRRALDAVFPGAPLVLVCGMLADKDVQAAARAWAGRVERVIAVAPDSPRALAPEVLADAFRRAGVRRVETAAAWQEGLTLGLEGVRGRADAVLCVCGSLYLVGPARRWLRAGRANAGGGAG